MTKQHQEKQNIMDKATDHRTYGTIAVFLLAAVLIAMLPQTGEARPGKGMRRSPEQITTMLADRLDLTEEQTAAIAPIIADDRESRKEVFEKFAPQRRKMREAVRREMAEIDKSTGAQLKRILTGEQMEQYRELREKQRRRWHERAEHRGAFNDDRPRQEKY